MARGQYNTTLPKRLTFFRTGEEGKWTFYGPYLKKPTSVFKSIKGTWIYYVLRDDKTYQQVTEDGEIMTASDADILYYKMRDEGFDYCFNGYSRWEDINDPKFQQLKERYVQASKELKEYIEEMYKHYSEKGDI